MPTKTRLKDPITVYMTSLRPTADRLQAERADLLAENFNGDGQIRTAEDEYLPIAPLQEFFKYGLYEVRTYDPVRDYDKLKIASYRGELET